MKAVSFRRVAVLFGELFRISLFVLGGGYSILAVADDVFARKGWIRNEELIDNLPVFQMIPGLIATHTAVYVGNRVAGWVGAVVGVVAVALPSVVIFTLATIWYHALPLDNSLLLSAFVGLRAALAGIIAATVIRSWRKFMKDAFAYALFIAGTALIAFVHAPIAAVLVASMVCGVAMDALKSRQKQGGVATYRSISLLPLLCFLQYGLLCFGGGFVLVPMYMDDFVGLDADFLRLTEMEFSNVMALSQMTPGPIGVNCATYFGYRLSGVAGAVVASAMLLLPGSVIAFFVFRSLERFRTNRIVQGVLRGVRPASLALMCVALWAFVRMAVTGGGEKFNTTGAILVIITTYMTMKKRINLILLILLCAGASCAVRADEITTDMFPDADIVILDESEHVAYNPDGTSETREETFAKILTERGRRDESQQRLGYNARYGKARFVHVGIIGTNGVERTVDIAGSTKEMTDNSSLAVNIVDPLDRVIVCTIPGLCIGETLHVKTERCTEKSRVKDQWSDISLLEWSHPILRSVYSVKAPAARPIKSHAILHSLGNVTEEILPQPDGSTLYVYTATNSPRMFPEPDMPPQWTQVQSVHLSTASDWRELSRWYWDLSVPHLEKTNVAMTNKVAELGKDMKAIFRFVSQEIRYMGLTMEDTSPGYAPHDVNVTFDNRYGVCRDKAGLLVALLRIAGFRAFPVLINVGAKMAPEVPKPYFNHAIVAVECPEGTGTVADGKYVLMDPTNENTKDLFPGYLCNCSYLVARPEGETLMTSPVPSPDRNAVNVTTRGSLRDDGTLTADVDLAFLGINDTIYRGALARATPERRVAFFEGRIRSVCPGAELVRCTIAPSNLRDTAVPLTASLLVKVPGAVLRGETEDVLSVLFASRSFSIANYLLAGNTALEKRRYPLVLDTTACVSECVEIDLGSALGPVRRLPERMAITNGYGYARAFSVSNGVLRATRRQEVGTVEFAPAEYAMLREDIKCVEAAERKDPVFAANGLQGANVNVRLDATEVDIASDTEWTVTNTIVKEVLTYRGKKDSAELSFAYNPTWKRVTVLSATVSNLNGVVSRVKPVEMNVLDASWAASAPRYPAGKTLVVNLPAVEIGSVISVTVESVITNAPAPYYAIFAFDARDALERKRVRVDDWVRDVRHTHRVPDEPRQPASSLWRDIVTISKCSFTKIAPVLRRAADVESVCGDAVPDMGTEVLCSDGSSTVMSIRNWMAKNVRLAGPSLYEVPIADQLTAPDIVLRERYATRLDYIRTLCALLKGAGCDADIVFAARNATRAVAERERDKVLFPNVRAFDTAVCRVRVREGGFLGFGGVERTYYLGTENEYAPLEATELDGCDVFDPESETFGIVSAEDGGEDFVTRAVEEVRIDVRESGAVDYDIETKLWGSAVGPFRKRYEEMLPEDFSRHYQALLGNVSQAATAVSELKPDTKAYPATLAFSCYVPDYATVEEDAITLRLPAMECPFPALDGSFRRTPVQLENCRETIETVVLRFPEGYDAIECVPTPFVFLDPLCGAPLSVGNVTHAMEEGRLVVRLTRRTLPHPNLPYPASYAEFFRDARRRLTDIASRTVKVRRSAR